MEVSDMIEDEFEDFYERISRPRRTRQIRFKPDYMVLLDENDFRSRFRLSKTGVRHILSLVNHEIRTTTMRNCAITATERLLLTLRFYATGSYLLTLADFSGVSKASASRIISIVTKSIASLRCNFIRIPDDVTQLQKEFYKIAKFPKVFGAIDCTHVCIKSPGGESAETFRNRKSSFSINVQVLCSAKLKILDIVARWPGSSHDQTVFENSSFKVHLTAGRYAGIIVADRGYENTDKVLTPLQNPTTPAEHLYNEAQIRTRNVAERTFGVWKSRFRVLHRKITLALDKAQMIITACAVLHNIAIDLKEDVFPSETDDYEQIRYPVTSSSSNSNNYVRNTYVEYFDSLLASGRSNLSVNI